MFVKQSEIEKIILDNEYKFFMKAYQKTCKFVGMLHVPINSILVYPPHIRKALNLPEVSAEDWKIIQNMDRLTGISSGCGILESPVLDLGVDVVYQLEEEVGRISFIQFLQERLLREVELYFESGADVLMLENIAAPYFVRDRQPLVIFAVMSRLARLLRDQYPAQEFGVQILAFGENLAMDIAVRYGFSFVRGESLLFLGQRPEGSTPNQGNLAKLYMLRNLLVDTLPEQKKVTSKVYADIQKKHTIFSGELTQLDTWLENLLFLKLEGVVLTGSGTGKPVNLRDIQKTSTTVANMVQKSKEFLGREWQPEVIVGSGVSVDNLVECKKFATTVIVGSSLKEHGYWECPLDKGRLQQFMEKWHTE